MKEKTFGEIVKMKDEDLTPDELRWKQAITGQRKKLVKHIKKGGSIWDFLGMKR